MVTIAGEFPLSIGGGIGKSRVMLLLLKKMSIAEVIPTIWPDEMILKWQDQGIPVL
jgi:aspartate--ammonia ligase